MYIVWDQVMKITSFCDNNIIALGTFVTNAIFSYMGHLIRFSGANTFFCNNFGLLSHTYELAMFYSLGT
jgi:hypothetical protein